MEPAVGLAGLLMMAIGLVLAVTAMESATAIVGAVLFSGGIISLALALGLGHLRRIRKTMDEIAVNTANETKSR